MKRTSLLLIVFLLIISSIVQAKDYYHVPLRNRVRWSPYKQGLIYGHVKISPYAYEYGSNGLVHERLEYSPYAFSYKSNGLICNDFEVSPYAFSYGNPGFVDQYAQYSPYAFSYNSSGLISCISTNCGNYDSCNEQKKTKNDNLSIPNSSGKTISKSTTYTRQISHEIISARKAKLELQKNNDPSEAIRQYLKIKNLKFRAGRYLRIDSNTVSVDFVIEDANIVIKFWNTKLVSDLVKQNDHQTKIYENYFESWKEYCLKHYNKDSIYHIFSSDKEDLMKQLASVSTTQEKTYAIAKN